MCQVGVKLASNWPANNPDYNPIKLSQSQIKKLQLWLLVQAQENCSQGVEEHYTILCSITVQSLNVSMPRLTIAIVNAQEGDAKYLLCFTNV